MATEQTIAQLLRDTEQPVDPKWLEETLEAHPTFILPVIMLLKRNPQSVDAETLRRLQTKAVLNFADRSAMADIIDLTESGWADFYPQTEAAQKTTEQTIDDFITTFGRPSTPEEDSVLERLLFNPVPLDYFSGTDEPYDPTDPLALPPELMPNDKDEETESEKQDKKTEQEAPEHNSGKNQIETASTPGDESLLMESLAKIFIKQRRYGRAYEIISKLSLNYPEKSVYFADQLRFLQKLIYNQQFLTK